MGVKTYYLLSNEHGNFVGMRAFSWLKERLAARSRTATGSFEVKPGNWRKQIEPLYAFLRRHSPSVGQLQKLKCANPRKDQLYNSLVPKRKAKKKAPRPAVAPAAPRQERFAIREGRMVRVHI